MNWCNKLTGNTCKLIKRIMSTFPTAAQRRYKKLNFIFYIILWKLILAKGFYFTYCLILVLVLVLFLFLNFSRP